MRRHPARLDIRRRGRIVLILLCLLAWVGWSNDLVPDVDPAGFSDPVERQFYQELRALRERQKTLRQELTESELSPEDRLERRRVLLVQSHRELQKLETEYQPKLSPEARARWMERKASRQKRFDRLQDKPAPGPATGQTKDRPHRDKSR